MSLKKADALVQKLTLNLPDDEAKSIVDNIVSLLGEEKSLELLEQLLDSSEISDQISAILISCYWKNKQGTNLIYKKISFAHLSHTAPALIRFIYHQKDSPSQKLLLKILSQDLPEEILILGFKVALEQKAQNFSAAFGEILERKNLPELEESMAQEIQKLPLKKQVGVMKLLLKQPQKKAILFALKKLSTNPTPEMASLLSKLMGPEMEEEIFLALVELSVHLPENPSTIILIRRFLEHSPKIEEETWKKSMALFFLFSEPRQRTVAEYFKSFFDTFPFDRQRDILHFLGKIQSPYDVLFLCQLVVRSPQMGPEAGEILEKFNRQEPLYEIFRFMETSKEDTSSLVSILIKIGDKKGLAQMEDFFAQFPASFHRDFIPKVFAHSSSNVLLTALFKNVSRSYNKLEEFGTVLVGIDKLPRCYEREKELQIILKRFRREGNKSFILLGPSGSGKSAIINELSYRLISHGDDTYPFEVILQITTGDILAGTKYLGEWETRVNKLIQTLKNYKKVLLYVSNVNDLIWAGRSSSSRTNFASVMAPYIERGEIVVVGESTPEAYSIGIASEYNIKKLFQTIQINELDDDKTELVLKKMAMDLKAQVRRTKNVDVEVHSTVLNRIIELGTYYFPGIARPGNAAHLLQQVMETRTDDLVQDQISKEIKNMVLTPDDVMKTLANSMEVPELIINDNIKLDLEDVGKFFKERVLGQEEAVDSLVSLISLIKAGLSNPERPHGVFFFIGPTGVGKTEMARVLAEYLTGNPDRLIRIDMSAFKDYSSFERLIGSHHNLTPQGSYMTPNLVEKIRNHPFSVILLDEFEKAHPNIFDLFLQVYDYGKLLDARSEVIDFRQSIIIMTSNIGYEEALEEQVGFGEKESLAMSIEEAKREMARTFRPEFINRIDKVVVFYPLDKPTMLKITHREIGKILSRSGILRRNLEVKVDDSVVELLLEKGFSPRLGARQLKRVVEEKLLNPLAKTIVHRGPEHGSHIFIYASDGEVKVMVKESRALSRNTRLLERVRKKSKNSTRLVSTDSLGKWVEELDSKITTLEAYCEAKGYHHWKRDLFRKTMEITFWDNPEQARNIMEEFHYLERILHSLSKLRKNITEIENLLEKIRSGTDKKYLTHTALRYLEVKKEYEIVEFEAHCETRKERADSFLTFSLSKPSIRSKNSIHTLYEIYLKWAEKSSFSFQPFSEELFPDGSLKSLTCYLQGVCVYGLLQRERGIHRFFQGTSSTLSDDIELEILPKIGKIKEEELEVYDEEKKSPSSFFSEIKSSIKIKHSVSNMVLFAANNRSKSDNILLLRDFMGAILSMDPQAPMSLVRSYNLEASSPEIYDHTLEASFQNVPDFLAGDIDELLIGRIQKLPLSSIKQEMDK